MIQPFFDILGLSSALMEKGGKGGKSRTFGSCLAEVTRNPPKTKQMQKAISLAQQFNKQLGNTIETAPPIDHLKKWRKALLPHAALFLHSQMVKEVLPVSIPLALQKHITGSPEKLSCFDYAFCQIGDKRALLQDFSNKEIPGLLKNLRYTPISQPASGDLVLYLNKGFPTHLGVYQGNRMVLSKWGNNIPKAYLHHLASTPSSYGDKIIFYRPPSQSDS